MPRAKKAAPAAEKVTKAAEKKVAKVVEKAPVEKAPVEKAPVEAVAEKAAEVKATVEAAAKKAAPNKAAPKKVAPKKPVPTKVNFFVEYGGVQVSVDEVVANIKATYGKEAKEIAVYLKPDESKAYFVADGEKGEMDVFFC